MTDAEMKQAFEDLEEDFRYLEAILEQASRL